MTPQEMTETPAFNGWLSRLCGVDFCAQVQLRSRVKENLPRAYDEEYLGAG